MCIILDKIPYVHLIIQDYIFYLKCEQVILVVISRKKFMNKVVDLKALTFFTESARKVEIKLFEQSLSSASFLYCLLGKLSVPFVEHCSILLNFL